MSGVDLRAVQYHNGSEPISAACGSCPPAHTCRQPQSQRSSPSPPPAPCFASHQVRPITATGCGRPPGEMLAEAGGDISGRRNPRTSRRGQRQRWRRNYHQPVAIHGGPTVRLGLPGVTPHRPWIFQEPRPCPPRKKKTGGASSRMAEGQAPPALSALRNRLMASGMLR